MVSMDTVHVNAYAKLNLTLDIVGTGEGYHLIDSVMATVDLFDRIVLKKRKGLSRIFVHGAQIPPEQNSALAAAEAFSDRFGVDGADITVYKNIPIGAGMGGSSADAAGVIAGMGRLYAVSDMGAMYELARSLGSDAPFQLHGGICRARGRGELLTPLPFHELYFLVLVPRVPVLSAAAYRTFDEMGLSGGARTGLAAEELEGGRVDWAAKCFGNDLYPAACALEPAVREAYLYLKSLSPGGVSMTGSGSAVFACFESRELAEWGQSRYRGKCRTFVLKTVPQENGRK